MRRILLALIVTVIASTLPAVAQARHGHWHRGRTGGHWHSGGHWNHGHWNHGHWNHGHWNHGHWHGGRHWHRHGGWGYPVWGGGFYGGWGGISLSVGWPAYGFGYGGYAPVYNYPLLYDGCYGYSGVSPAVVPAYGVRYSPRANYVEYFVDSSYEPAELAYGPLAVKQFLGLDRNFALGELRRPVQPTQEKVVRLKVRTSNAESRRRADRYIAQGDELFQKQQWHSALQKYKLAGQLAPDLAECSWRQGHALIAVNQFDQAAAAFRRALMIAEDTSRGGFQLNDLYADSVAAKESHLEALAGEALAATINPDAYFLIGVTLHYDGQPARARKFFEKAREMSTEDRRLVESFLTPKPAPSLPVLTLPVKADEMEI